jgi:hypothetical protein
MDTSQLNPTHIYPHAFGDDTDESQFNEPWDPTRDDLVRIVNLGYSRLSLNAKNMYNIINDLTKMGESGITISKLAEIPYYKRRSAHTIYNALRDLKNVNLISREDRGEITILEPDARDEDFQAYIATL